MGFDIAAVSAPIASGQKGFGSGRVSGMKLPVDAVLFTEPEN
jgi:hypothetical protein